jgi:hypothetical protein
LHPGVLPWKKGVAGVNARHQALIRAGVVD